MKYDKEKQQIHEVIVIIAFICLFHSLITIINQYLLIIVLLIDTIKAYSCISGSDSFILAGSFLSEL